MVLLSFCFASLLNNFSLSSWFKIGKVVHQGYILSPCLFKFYAVYIIQNTGLDEAQPEIKIVGKDTDNLRQVYNTTVKAERKKELKSLLMMMKEESEKAALKLNIQKTKIMASILMTSWQIDRETMTVTDFIFLGSKITVDSD